MLSVMNVEPGATCLESVPQHVVHAHLARVTMTVKAGAPAPITKKVSALIATKVAVGVLVLTQEGAVTI